MNRPLKIGVDVDDILNDFFPHWIESWNKINGSNYDPQTVYQWDLTKFIPGYEWDEFLKVIDSQEFYDTLYSKLKLNGTHFILKFNREK